MSAAEAMAVDAVSSASDALGFSPIALVDDLVNCVEFTIADCADDMEATLLQHPELAKDPKGVRQGVDLWQLKVQRAADKNFDKFESYVLAADKNVLTVPDDLQLAPPESTASEEDARLDAEIDALWLQLQTALASKRELLRKLKNAQATTELWTTHRHSVEQLAASQQAAGVENTLQGVRNLTSTLQDGMQLLKPSDGAGSSRGLAAPGPRGALQRYAQRRTQIATTSASDLLHISSLLSAS